MGFNLRNQIILVSCLEGLVSKFGYKIPIYSLFSVSNLKKFMMLYLLDNFFPFFNLITLTYTLFTLKSMESLNLESKVDNMYVFYRNVIYCLIEGNK